MSKFKAGDKVVRTHISRDEVIEGETYIVRCYIDESNILLEGKNLSYSQCFFELVKEEQMTQQFKNMKFDVAAIAKELGIKHEEASRIIQEALFGLGYVWRDGSKQVLDTTEKVIVCDSAGFMHWTRWVNECFQHESVKIKQTFSIVPIEQEEFVELNGKKYNKKELEAALSMLKPVEE